MPFWLKMIGSIISSTSIRSWLGMDDLTKIVLEEVAVVQGRVNPPPLLEEPLWNINQPPDRWEGQLTINTPQGRY